MGLLMERLHSRDQRTSWSLVTGTQYPGAALKTCGFDVVLFSAMIRFVTDDREYLEEIRSAFRTAHYEVSRHATARMLRRGIRTDEIEDAMGRAEIIEDYPDDKYGPSLLLLGFTRDGRPLHVQIARSRMRIVTVYEPDPQEWLNWRIRRSSHG